MLRLIVNLYHMKLSTLYSRLADRVYHDGSLRANLRLCSHKHTMWIR